jgi:palmitoyl-protein thioesterase
MAVSLHRPVRRPRPLYVAPSVRAYCSRVSRFILYLPTGAFAVVPRDSAWFSFFDGERLIPLREQPLYLEDWIGLRSLDEQGRLILDEIPGVHMQFTLQWFTDNVIAKYLAGSSSQR